MAKLTNLANWKQNLVNFVKFVMQKKMTYARTDVILSDFILL